MTFQGFVILLECMFNEIAVIFSYFEATNLKVVAHFRDLLDKRLLEDKEIVYNYYAISAIFAYHTIAIMPMGQCNKYC